MSATSTMISISDEAVDKLREFLDDQGTPEYALRVFVAPGGCSGLQYGMTIEESAEELAAAITQRETDRVRYAAATRVPESVRRAAAETQTFIADAPVLAEGRVELLWYVQEQSVCFDYHRYGNLGARSVEVRAALVAPEAKAD